VSRSLIVAGLQAAGVPGDPAATLESFEERVRNLRRVHGGVDLVLAPELHLMALGPMLHTGSTTMEDLAEPVPGPLTERLAALAQETGLWLVPGSIYEQGDGGVYNTAVVLSPAGDLVATYRKCFTWQPYERTLAGDSATTFEVDGVGRIGLAICHDGVFPELWRRLMRDGAEAVLQVSLTRTSDRDAEVAAARANALVNQFHLVNVNAADPVGNGRSVVVDPEGVIRYEAGSGDEVVTALLDLDATALVRERGSFGINRLVDQLERSDLHL
jgi:formamidase